MVAGWGANTRYSWEGEPYYRYSLEGVGEGITGTPGTTKGNTDYGLEYPYHYETGRTQTEVGHTRIFKNETITREGITAYWGNATYEGSDIVINEIRKNAGDGYTIITFLGE